MSGNSEEKTLPPTEHKLRKAREKGQVASSADFVTGVSVVVGVTYLVFAWPGIVTSISRLFDLSILSITNSGPRAGLALFLTLVFEMGYILSPFIISIVLAGIVANILDKQGIPFSMHPIKPDFKKINPGEGLKKLFSKRNATEFATSFVKIVIWFVLAGVFTWLLLQSILASVYCSIGCVMQTAYSLGLLLMVAAMILLIFLGLLDLPMQHALFNHEQKMGHKELKKELKDILGSPEFKSHRRREHQRLVSGPAGGNPEVAAAMQETGGAGNTGKAQLGGITTVIRGFDSAVGLFFHKEHADVPIVAIKFKGSDFAQKMSNLERSDIHIEYDQELAADIIRTVDIGKIIRERHFEKVARVLVNTGALG